MFLSSFFKGSKPKEYFFGLLLKENKGIGYIISGENRRLSLVTKKEFIFSNGWENLSEDVDEVLFKLENETKCRIEKTIFFLFSHLVDDKTKEIRKLQLQKIKELTKNLEIKPIGYIECYEAVSDYLQRQEGMPLTSILIELDDKSVDVFVYKGGHKMHNYIVSRTDNIIDDLEAVFDTFGKNTYLPNRLILYNSSNLVNESTKIISHKWSSDLFVQIPRVEILNENQIFEGLLSLFEKQIYESTQNAVEPNNLQPKEIMGFLIGKDVETIQDQDTVIEKKTNTFNIKYLFLNLIAKLKTSRISIKKPNKGLFIGILVICLMTTILVSSEFFFHKAVVTVFFPSFPITKSVTVDAVVDEVKGNFLTVYVATSSVDMKDVKITTGKRDIGEKAKGEITLFNFDDKDKTFPKGTVLQVDNLQFGTDEEVKVAASTLASDASAKLPGKSKVKVTANDIGSESNIDKGKRFKIDDLSSSVYFGMNENGFTGGTRKSIKTVSKKDMDDLKLSLLQKAKDQQKETIYQTKKQNITLIDPLINFQLSDVVFSKELGEEGENLSLKAKAIASYYYFDTLVMNIFLKNISRGDVNGGYKIEDKNLHYIIDTAKENKSGITIQLHMDAKATKEVDMKNVKESMLLKTAGQVEAMLKTKFGASSSTIELKPNLLLFNNILPFLKRNIDVRIESL